VFFNVYLRQVMFVRTKKHPGSKNSSVLICYSIREGHRVCQKVLCNLGKGSTKEELFILKSKAMEKLSHLKVIQPIEKPKVIMDITPVLWKNVQEISRQNAGVPDILGSLYDELGFSRILHGKAGNILKAVVLSRFIEPASKHKSISIIESKFGDFYTADAIYRMMDVLGENLRKSHEIVFNATKEATGGKIDLMLFDVTTLHFETIAEDELRAFGYSKNFRFNTTQVVLALATTEDGLPVGYRLFPGNTAEVSTLIQSVNYWKKIIPVGQVIIIGDRAMMGEDNIKKLEEANLKYIIAYPMKKSPRVIKDQILSDANYTPDVIQNELHWKKEIEIKEGQRLIVTYNPKRHARDQKQRERLIERIKKKLGKTKKAKRLVSNLGYLKYTTMDNECIAELNEDKIAEDSRWDGLHGVMTNTELSAKEVVEKYKKLWTIEESFRISKHNFKMRPIYHFTAKRIISHIDICFLTFALIRHAQDRLKKGGYTLSVEQLREELIKVEASILEDSSTGKLYRSPSFMTYQAEKIYQIFDREQDLKMRAIN
jgi:transposase